VGYSVDHANDVYWMFNFKTKRVIHSRDVVWLEQSYKSWIITNILSEEEYDYVDNDDGYVQRSTKKQTTLKGFKPLKIKFRTSKVERKSCSKIKFIYKLLFCVNCEPII
jgi:hypothetical protein